MPLKTLNNIGEVNQPAKAAILSERRAKMVYVQNEAGEPLMPTHAAKARVLLKEKRATVVTVKPFTIRLLYETTNYTQAVTLGVDSGYAHIGFSAVSAGKELISGEAELLEGMKERLYERTMYRRSRRQRLRYRQPRFDNRVSSKKNGWLAPSIKHKLDSHLRVIDKISKILPVSKVIVEVANFDIQRIVNPDIQGKEYQQGEQLSSWNVREYVLHRDGHRCQNPECKNNDRNPILETHHLSYRRNGATERPSDLITLCTKCHTAENHRGFLKDWKPKLRNFKDAAFMSAVRWRLVEMLSRFAEAEHTYGYITKHRRIAQGLEKSHANDAFCIAGGEKQSRSAPIAFRQIRRNNRSLERFYDARYIDARTGAKAAAGSLNSGRRTRNKSSNGENLRKYRGPKLSKGRRSIRVKRYPYQPNDLVRYEGKIRTVKGTQNLGGYVALRDVKKVPRADQLTPYKYRKGFA